MEDKQKKEDLKNEKEKLIEEVEQKDKANVEEIKEINIDYKDMALRALADLENYKKRSLDENKSFKEFACFNVITDFIPMYDNLKKAVEYIPEKEKEIPWVKGIVMIATQFNDMLKNYNVEEFSALNKKFDHDSMDAIMTDKDETKDEDVVLKEIAHGYKLNGKIVIHAKVVVNKK